VGVLRKPGKGSLHSSRLRKPDQLSHKGEPLAGRVEGSYGLAASPAGVAVPMQAMTEIGLGILLVIGLLTRPAAFL